MTLTLPIIGLGLVVGTLLWVRQRIEQEPYREATTFGLRSSVRIFSARPYDWRVDGE